MNIEIAKKASKWWADKLRNKALLNNGDRSISGNATLGLALIAQQRVKANQTQEKINLFEEKLTAAILIKLKESQKLGMIMWIGCDYGADQLLCGAAKEANLQIGITSLPWKTNMMICIDSTIKVSCGYAADYIEI